MKINKNLMKLLAAILIIAVSLVVVASLNAKWKIEYGWTSGWGNGPNLLINSNGKMTSVQFYPDEKKVCESALERSLLKELKKNIDSIPDSIPYGTLTRYLDHCADEKENYIDVTINDNRRAFSYSQSTQCWVTEVPEWLLTFYSSLNQHTKTIENCKIVTDSNNNKK